MATLALSVSAPAHTSEAADNATATPTPAAPRDPVPADFSRPSKASIPSPTVLRAYLQLKERRAGTSMAGRPQHFCFVQQRSTPPEDPGPFVWMIWQDGGEILNLGRLPAQVHATAQEAEEDGQGLARSKSIHLATDVRETAQEISGSSFLVERAWVNRLLAQCKAKGRTIKVAPAR